MSGSSSIVRISVARKDKAATTTTTTTTPYKKLDEAAEMSVKLSGHFGSFVAPTSSPPRKPFMGHGDMVDTYNAVLARDPDYINRFWAGSRARWSKVRAPYWNGTPHDDKLLPVPMDIEPTGAAADPQ